MKKKVELLIIIATYNERDNIASLIDLIFTLNSNIDLNILAVDDNSPDKTYDIVIDLKNNKYQDKLFLLKRSGKLGLGTAYVAGFDWALYHNTENRSYQYIMHMDADFSHNPQYVKDFLTAVQDNDLVIGSRYINGGGVINWGIIRQIISKCGGIYARIILGLPVKDLTGGFKCFRASVLEKINIYELKSNGYSFQVETTYRTFLHKFKIKEIPIIFEDRRVGKSKMSYRIFLEALYMIIKLKLNSLSCKDKLR